MRQALLLTAFVLGLSFATQAQNNDANNAGNVKLNLKLNPIQTLMVNNGQKEINLVYKTKEDYKNGVSSAQSDHLSVYSTGGFQVYVKSSGDLIGTSDKSISSGSIQIVPTKGSDGIDAEYKKQSLSSSEQAIVSAKTGGINKTISIDYNGAGAEAYLNDYIAGQTATIYSTTVIYTIVAQ